MTVAIWLVASVSSQQLVTINRIQRECWRANTFDVDVRALGTATDSDAGVANCYLLVKGKMFAELTQ